jgi:septum formation protein
MTKIILATTSPYRRETFGYLGIPFEAEASNVDESQLERDNPEKLVRELSKLKAESVAKNHSDAIVIGMDSVTHFNGQILEKPKLREEDFQRLKALSGNSHQFYTGIHMINIASGKTLSKIVKTDVLMREFSDEEINKYLDEDPNFNTYALGYDPVKHISASFVKKIEGSYYNLLGGIPLETIIEMLKEIGYKER